MFAHPTVIHSPRIAALSSSIIIPYYLVCAYTCGLLPRSGQRKGIQTMCLAASPFKISRSIAARLCRVLGTPCSCSVVPMVFRSLPKATDMVPSLLCDLLARSISARLLLVMYGPRFTPLETRLLRIFGSARQIQLSDILLNPARKECCLLWQSDNHHLVLMRPRVRVSRRSHCSVTNLAGSSLFLPLAQVCERHSFAGYI
jgi:hypothetical protein